MITMHEIAAQLREVQQLKGADKKQKVKELFHKTKWFYAICPYLFDPRYVYKFKRIAAFEAQEKITSLTWPELRAFLDCMRKKQAAASSDRHILNTILHKCNAEDAAFIKAVVTRTLKLGVQAKTINQIAVKARLESPIALFEVMQAQKDKAQINYPCLVEEKLDGVRCIAEIKGGVVTLRSRGGLIFHNFTLIALELSRCPDGVLDGELMHTSLQELMVYVHAKEKVAPPTIYYSIFDALTLKEWEAGGSKVPLKTRKLRLIQYRICARTSIVRINPEKLVYTEQEIDLHLARVLEDGGEGLMVKDPEGIYAKRRSKAWIKLKGVTTYDVVVQECLEGQGRLMGSLGAFSISYNNVKVSVGSGFSDEQRRVFWVRRKELVGSVVEIAVGMDTQGGAFREGRFIRLREDKNEGE